MDIEESRWLQAVTSESPEAGQHALTQDCENERENDGCKLRNQHRHEEPFVALHRNEQKTMNEHEKVQIDNSISLSFWLQCDRRNTKNQQPTT